MAVQIRPEGRSFSNGWISDTTKAHSQDAFRYPRGWWLSRTEKGAVETAPGHVLVESTAGTYSHLYTAKSDSGQELRISQIGEEIWQRDLGGVAAVRIYAGLAVGLRITCSAMQEKNPDGTFGKEFVCCFDGVDEPFKIEVLDDVVAAVTALSVVDTFDAGTALNSNGALFVTNGIIDGWFIQNTTDGSYGYVTGIVDEDNLTTTQLVGGTTNNWNLGDSFQITRVSLIGLDRPDPSQIAITKDTSGQRNVRGFVRYFIAEVNGTNESPLSIESGRVNAVDDVEDGPNAALGVRILLEFDDVLYYNNTYRIYRTYKDGAEPYFIGTVNVGATSTFFVDDLHDADLSDPPFAHGDKPPKEITSVITYFNRMYGLAGNFLYWSDVAQPQSWYVASDGNFVQVGQQDGDVGTALMRGRNGIYFDKRAHLYKIWGRTPRDFEIEEIIPSDSPTRSIGVPSPTAFTYTEKGIYFYYDRRFYFLDPRNDTVRRLSHAVEQDIEILLGDPLPTENGPFDVVIGRDSTIGRIWATAGDATFFFDEAENRFVGAHEHGYNCFLMEGFGPDAVFLMGGYHTKNVQGPASELTNLYKANYDKAFEGRDLLFAPLPFVGTVPMVRRFNWLDWWMGDPALAIGANNQVVNAAAIGGNFVLDILIGIDGQEVIRYDAVQAMPVTSRRRHIFRMYLEMLGHDLEAILIYPAGANEGRQLVLYHLENSQQALRGHAGTLLGGA